VRVELVVVLAAGGPQAARNALEPYCHAPTTSGAQVIRRSPKAQNTARSSSHLSRTSSFTDDGGSDGASGHRAPPNECAKRRWKDGRGEEQGKRAKPSAHEQEGKANARNQILVNRSTATERPSSEQLLHERSRRSSGVEWPVKARAAAEEVVRAQESEGRANMLKGGGKM
jgi:hypothetical protein